MQVRVALVLLAVAAALAPLPPGIVERRYSADLYLRLQSLLTPLSNLVPFALFDALIIIFVGGWLAALILDVLRPQRAWLGVAGRLVLRTVVWGAALYLLFLAVWGLNYRRTKLSDKLQFDASTVSSAAVLTVGRTTVVELNALYDAARAPGGTAAGAVDRSLPAAFEHVQRQLGIRRAAVGGRPKWSLLDPYFRRAGVAGMTDPYFLETLVAGDLLPFERPFVIAHEWGHLAGYADESEANFVGWLTCLNGSAGDKYSGWLFLYSEMARAARGRDRAELVGRLAPGPRADLQAIARRLQQQISPAVSAAGWRVYDRYLKANRVEAGAASYGEVVRLVLGVRFGPGWTPLLVD